MPAYITVIVNCCLNKCQSFFKKQIGDICNDRFVRFLDDNKTLLGMKFVVKGFSL